MRGIVDECTDSAALVDGAGVYGRSAIVPDKPLRTRVPHAKANYVRLEIRTDTLYNLINDKSLVIEDLRGLDGQAKTWITKRLLEMLLL